MQSSDCSFFSCRLFSAWDMRSASTLATAAGFNRCHASRNVFRGIFSGYSPLPAAKVFEGLAFLPRQVPRGVASWSTNISYSWHDPMFSARRYASTAGASTTAEQAASMYPTGSSAQLLFDRCMETAGFAGTNLTADYTPWFPVDVMQTLLLDVHAYTGCSWFSAIIFTVLGIRVATLPVSIAAIRSSREKGRITPEYQKLSEKLASAKGDQEAAQKAQEGMKKFTDKHGRFFMLKGNWNLFLVQMPLYWSAFVSLRGFASHPHLFPSFTMEAPLWLDSLALADPYMLLPLINAGVLLSNAEFFGSIDTESAQVGGNATTQKYQKWMMRGMAVGFVPVMSKFPSAVFVFMITNMVSATLLNRTLNLPTFERIFELPPKVVEAPKREVEGAAIGPGSHPAFTSGLASGPPALTPMAFTLNMEIKNNSLVPRAPGAVPVASDQSMMSLPQLTHRQQPSVFVGGPSRAVRAAALRVPLGPPLAPVNGVPLGPPLAPVNGVALRRTLEIEALASTGWQRHGGQFVTGASADVARKLEELKVQPQYRVRRARA